MESTNRITHLISNLIKYKLIWIAAMIIGLLAAGIYAFLIKSDVYTAHQTLVMRDDLLGSAFKPGQFESLDTMKSAQETVLELARKPQVVRNALKNLGPESGMGLGKGTGSWPSEKDIESIQGDISFSAPNGAEFGATEVIVLNAKASGRERALNFVSFLLTEIDAKLSEVRKAKIDSMVSELAQANTAAGEKMNEAAQRLREMEAQIGEDISTLRSMNDPRGGTSAFDSELNQIRSEQRLAKTELASAIKQRDLMQQALANPNFDLATSSELLTMQPSLATMVQSLAAAKAAEATALGTYTVAHPLARNARDAVSAARQQVYASIAPAMAGLESQIQALQSKVNSLDYVLLNKKARLSDITSQRVSYSTLDKEVEKKRDILAQTQGKLAEMESLSRSTTSTDLLTRVDSPQVSTKPDGLGKKPLLIAGALGGLLIGLGLVLLVAPPFVDPELDQHEGYSAAGVAPARRGAPAQTSASAPRGAAVQATAPATSRAASRLEEIAVKTSGGENQSGASSAPTPVVPLSDVIASKLEAYEARQASSTVSQSTKPEIVVTPRTPQQPTSTANPSAAANPTPTNSGANAALSAAGIAASIAAAKAAIDAPTSASATRTSVPEIVATPKVSLTTESLASTLGIEDSKDVASQIDSLAKDLHEATQPKTSPAIRETASTIQMEAQEAIDAAGSLPLRRRKQNDRPSDIAKSAASFVPNSDPQSAVDQAFSGVQDRKEPSAPNPFLKNDKQRANPFAAQDKAAVEVAPAPEPKPATSTSPRALDPKIAAATSVPAASPEAQTKPDAEPEFEQMDASIRTPALTASALPIPQQIRQLSDSILSFAKPADDSAPE